jgi:CRISPR-associated endonuclease/helicase Cas3
MNSILAKTNPDETLENHLNNVINIWKKLITIYYEYIQDDDFWQYSFFSVIFHDFGKVCRNFQDVINSTNKNYDNYIRHEFLSGMYIYYLNNENTINNNLSLLSIFSHHKKLSDDLFKDDVNKDLILKADEMNRITSFIKNNIENNGYQLSLKKTFEEYNEFFEKKVNLNKLYLKFYDFYISSIQSIKYEDRKKYILYKAILTISDWIASGDKNLKKGISFNINFLIKKIIEKLRKEKKEKIADSFEFRNFQKESIIDNNIIALAPTGSGKTEASLLWASNKKENDRIIYLLPTRVTSNAIYKRLTEYFGEEYTAIIHSSAYLFMKDIDESYNRTEWLKDKTFFKKINICTIDQILNLGFNIGYWEIKTFNMINARVIIDEIHLYQPYTLGLILSTIKYLKNEFGVKFYIMSATMPSKLINLLSKSLDGSCNIIQDKELFESSRNEFQYRDSCIDDLENEILNKINENKKVLIVVNTVNESIRIYEKLKKKKIKNIMCYHSRFIQMHRIRKEKVISKLEEKDIKFTLIATQVVEVSLDIDFDVLFTENAPIDAIIQRSGRVNRKREKPDTKVIIFRHTDITENFVYEKPEILANSFNIFKKNNNLRLSEKSLIEFVDEVYKDYNVENDVSFIEGLNKYEEIQEKYCYIKDNVGDDKVFTREGLDTENIIPACFEEIISKMKIEEKVKFEISIKKNYKFKYHIDKDGFKILENCEYDYNRGLIMNDRQINCLCL